MVLSKSEPSWTEKEVVIARRRPGGGFRDQPSGLPVEMAWLGLAATTRRLRVEVTTCGTGRCEGIATFACDEAG